MKEEFRWIKGFEGYYQISNMGRVYSFPRYDENMCRHGGIFLKQQKRKDGYLTVHLKKHSLRYAKLIHKLVAESFIPNPNHKNQIDHIDADKSNNVVSNLRWCTSMENKANPITYNRLIEKSRSNKMLGKKNPFSRAVAQYNLDGDFIAEYESCGDASRQTGVSVDSIQMCASGKHKTGMGYKWKYTSNAICNRKNIVLYTNKPKAVCKYDKNMTLIEEYASIKEAALKNDRCEASIKQAIRNSGTSNGFFWKLKE